MFRIFLTNLGKYAEGVLIFDFAAYGRDMEFSSTFVFTSYGNCVEILK